MHASISRQLFNGALRSEDAWRRKAAQLYQAAMLILEDASEAHSALDRRLFQGGSRSLTKQDSYELQRFNLHEVGFYLIGMTFENLFKGLWIMQNPGDAALVESVRSRFPGFSNHMLKEFARKTHFTISIEEETILDALTEHILWVGRYPVPLTRDKYHHTLSSGHPSYRISSAKSVFSMELPLPAKVSALLDRLVGAYENLERQTEVDRA
jgi:hypothetical protein